MESILWLTTIVVVGGFFLMWLVVSIEKARSGEWNSAAGLAGFFVVLIIFPGLLGFLALNIGKSNVAIILIPIIVFLYLKGRT
tara:strand:+ start:173 stop:421 length:249 start_codon:yes stop_codon:yes gene_type:complete